MTKFSKKNLIIILILIISICSISTLTACNNQDKVRGSEHFDPIEVNDSINWSEKADYTVTPATYSNAITLWLAKQNVYVGEYELLDLDNLDYSYYYYGNDAELTSEEQERYDALFEADEDSGYDSFGFYRGYYLREDDEQEICIMMFKFFTKKSYMTEVTKEDINAAKAFYNSLAGNPITAAGEELNLTFLYENLVFVGNETGFQYLNKDYADVEKRLQDDEEFAKEINDIIGAISKTGISETRLTAIFSEVDKMNAPIDRETAFAADDDIEDYYNRYVDTVKSIIDSIIMNASIDQIALFAYNFALLNYQWEIEYYEECLNDLNPQSEYHEEYVARYTRYKEEAVNSKLTIESIPQSQFLTFSRILLTMAKSGLQLATVDETRMMLFMFEEESSIIEMASMLAKEIDAFNIGQNTMSLLISTLADMRIADAFFTGEIDNISMKQPTDDEEQQEYNSYLKAYDNGVHDALYAIKDDFSNILSIMSKALNSLKNADMTDYTQSDLSEYYDTYYVDGEEVTLAEYKQAELENIKYAIKACVSLVAPLTDADYELVLSKFDAVSAAMRAAFVQQGIELDEEYEDIDLPTKQEVIDALKDIAQMTDDDIQNIDEQGIDDLSDIMENLSYYFYPILEMFYN